MVAAEAKEEQPNVARTRAWKLNSKTGANQERSMDRMPVERGEAAFPIEEKNDTDQSGAKPTRKSIEANPSELGRPGREAKP